MLNNNIRKIFKIAPIIFLVFFTIPSLTLAASPANLDPGSTLSQYLQSVYAWVSYMTVGAATIAFILAAITYMKGDKDSINKAKKYAESGVIAMVIVASAYLFFTILSPDIFSK